MDSGEVSFMITDTEPLNDGPVIDNSPPAPTGLNTEEELYQLDCRTGEAVVVSSARGPQAWHERSFEPSNCDVEEADEQSSRNHLTEESYEEEGAHDFTCEEGMDTVDSGCSSQSEMGDEERGCVEMEAGKEKYYCKYCDTTWPFGHFRNAQQFGAHCSNCSRRRKVKEPQELTLRERNTRSRKAKRPTHSGKRRRHPKVSTDHDDAMLLCAAGDSLSSNNISSEEDFEASGISFLQQAALTSGNEASKTRKSSRTKGRKGKRKLDEVAPKMEEENNDPFAIPFVRMPSRVSSRNSTLASQGASKKPKRDRSAKKKKSSSSKSKKSPVATEVEPEQAAIIADSNSLGGLLEAIERKLTAETKKKESTALKQQVWEMRNEIGEQFDASVEDLRFRSVALLQDLRLDMVAKLEGLKIDLASELSFRETRRKKRLNEMRIQMNALNRILENGKKDRDNGLLVSTFGGKFDTALKQLEELKANLQKEFAAREQAMQQQFTEMRATCSLHLANIKQQMQEELNVKENRMQKELEDMKHKLHSVCSKIGAENSSYDPEPAASASSALSSLPEPENFTTTTTTTTTTTILTSPSLLPAGLRLGVLPSFVGLTTTMVGAGLSPSSATAPLKTKSKRASSAKKPIASATKQNGTASLAETDALAFGLAEIKSAIS